MSYILCVDVGLANIGAAVIDNAADIGGARPGLIVELAHLHTERIDQKARWRHSDDKARRVAEAARFYDDIIERHAIKKVMAELPIGGAPNSQAATDLAYASACLVSVAEVHATAFEWYSPDEVKRATCGSRTASKDQMMHAIAQLYPQVLHQFPTKKAREHVCDALGVWRAGMNGTLARL